MRVALYARVSSERQQARGPIGSQRRCGLTASASRGDEVATEFCVDGHSRPRLDRPGLDALRDAGMIGPPPSVRRWI
jgi:site-specific DNA recombinase